MREARLGMVVDNISASNYKGWLRTENLDRFRARLGQGFSQEKLRVTEVYPEKDCEMG
jgi:hypothetical protein